MVYIYKIIKSIYHETLYGNKINARCIAKCFLEIYINLLQSQRVKIYFTYM